MRDTKVVTPAASTKINDYEMVLIINPEIEEEALENEISNVNRFVSGKGGTVSETEKWGKRKLAYPIKHSLEGIYVLMKFKMNPEWSKELEANLRITENVLRHVLIKLGEATET